MSTLPTATLLRNGTEVEIRAFRDEDADDLTGLYLDLSRRSRHLRFFSMWGHFERLGEQAVGEDPDRRLDLIATDDGRVIAHAMYTRTGPERADVAFTVLDDYQHLGLGTAMLHRLADAAREHGITIFEATMLAENHDMIDVFRHSGYVAHFTVDADCITVEMSIEERSVRATDRTRRKSA